MAYGKAGPFGRTSPNWKPGATGGLSKDEHARRARIAQAIRELRDRQPDARMADIAKDFAVKPYFVRRVLSGAVFAAPKANNASS